MNETDKFLPLWVYILEEEEKQIGKSINKYKFCL